MPSPPAQQWVPDSGITTSSTPTAPRRGTPAHSPARRTSRARNTVTSVTLTSTGAAVTATVTSPGPSYAITPSAAVGTGLGNYTLKYVNGTLTVNQRPATVKADNQSKNYSDANPTLTAVAAGT